MPPADMQLLLDELEKKILSEFPDISVDRSLKSYRQFTYNSSYVANIIQRKNSLRVMLNDEYDRIKGMDGVVDAPDAHYGHMNRYVDIYNKKGVSTIVEYIMKMISLPDSNNTPNRIRIRLDKTAAD